MYTGRNHGISIQGNVSLECYLLLMD
jgi:hypothetical protein